MTTASASDAKKLLRSIADAKRAAVCLHEITDDDIPGDVGDFVLLYPDNRMVVATDAFMQRAALTFIAAERFIAGKPKPQISQRDLPRARKLVAAMRKALQTKRADDPMVVGPPNFLALAMANAPAP